MKLKQLLHGASNGEVDIQNKKMQTQDTDLETVIRGLVGEINSTPQTNPAAATASLLELTRGLLSLLQNVGERSAIGAAIPAKAVLIGGTDGTNLQGLKTNIRGEIIPADRRMDVFKTISATALGNTALWTPAAGKKFRLMALMVQVTAEAARAAAGDLTIDIQDGTNSTGLTFSVFVPAAAGTVFGAGYSTGWMMLGTGVLSAAANNTLNINLSAALTAGVVRVIAAGVEE